MAELHLPIADAPRRDIPLRYPPRVSEPCFADEYAALARLERVRWPNGTRCPHCGAGAGIGAVNGRGARPGLKCCCHCRKQFRATIGTLFHHSHVPAHKWLRATLLLAAPGGGTNAHRLHFDLDVSYKTALHIVATLDRAATPWLRMLAGDGDHPGIRSPDRGRRSGAALAGLTRRLADRNPDWFDRVLVCLLHSPAGAPALSEREPGCEKS